MKIISDNLCCFDKTYITQENQEKVYIIQYFNDYNYLYIYLWHGIRSNYLDYWNFLIDRLIYHSRIPCIQNFKIIVGTVSEIQIIYTEISRFKV